MIDLERGANAGAQVGRWAAGCVLKYSIAIARHSGPIVQVRMIKYNAQKCRKMSLLCMGQDIRSWRISYLVSVVFGAGGREKEVRVKFI
jgi:hypothetical protein